MATRVRIHRALILLACALGAAILLFRGWVRSHPAASALPPLEPLAAVTNLPAADPPVSTEPVVPVASNISAPIASEAQALDQILRLEDPIQRAMEFGRQYAEWFGRDAEAALAYLRRMPRGDPFNNALFHVLADIGQKNPGRALALAQQVATNTDQRVVYNMLFDQFARQDFQQAVQWLDQLPPGEGRVNAVRALAARRAQGDLEAALAWAQSLANPADRGPALESVLFDLAEIKPWQALEVAVRNLNGDELERSLSLILKELKTIDPDKAATLLHMLPAGETQTHATLDLVRAMSDRDPAAAVEWTRTLPTDELRQLAWRNVLDVWMAAAPAAASAFVAGMPAGSEQDRAAAYVAELLGGADPAFAVAWVQELPGCAARSAANIGLASGWARTDPAAATQWASSLPADHQQRTEAMDAALSYWVLADIPAAVQYVRGLPSGQLRDDGLDALSALLSAREPALAVELAVAIQNTQLREEVLAITYPEWEKTDPEVARNWLANTNRAPTQVNPDPND